LKETLKDESATKEQIEQKVKTLTEAAHKMAEEMYKKEQNPQEAEAEKKKKKADEDVIDAEIE
ncbi:MAG: hypothetical protein L3I99_07790, partial [Sulfurimonas sp.]|nr:hypothetical protein [Sulfurimonas sp.]